MMPEDETFPKILKKLRMDKRLTLREMAMEVKTNFAYLSQLEAGLAKPSEDLVKRIAEYFGKEKGFLEKHGLDEEKLIFLGRDIPAQIKEIKEKFPNIAPSYFRKAAKKEEK